METLAPTTEQTRSQRAMQKKLAEGRCAACGKVPPRKGKTTCQACTDRIVRQAKDRQARMKADLQRCREALEVCLREAQAILAHSKHKDDRNCAAVMEFHASRALNPVQDEPMAAAS